MIFFKKNNPAEFTNIKMEVLSSNEVSMVVGGACKYTFGCLITMDFRDICDFFLKCN